ncbi:uncharacterized protein LOC124286492 [Haliotis rubra]|uniref:uncharacterized protein LOC124286492 n=1 Tax=Haliotis rubra TaxID=36100 RepID=UPI001EE5E469|nr:uncharacterized protein LOC124286492 [Haliotis rubra]
MKAKDIICDSKKETKPVFPYGVDTALPVAGTFKADIKAGEMTLNEVEFIVVKRDGPSLLGRKTSQKLGVLKLGNSVNSLHTTIDFVKAFPECFEGFGKLKDYQLNIPIDSSVQPVIQNLRSVPYHLRERLSQKLEELEKLDIIEKVDELSKWVSPIVIVPSPERYTGVCGHESG